MSEVPPPDPTQPPQAPPGSQQSPPPPGWQQPPPGWQQPPAGYAGYPGYAPYGIHPGTGLPYSDKSKLVAGLLQILLPLGIGRFYIGDNKTGGWQLAVTLLTCGIGGLWPFIDGIVILVTDSRDAQGRILRS
ncbi:MAG TPA: TM2 domain-containing protein [Marmoricola sp.]